MNPVEAAIKKVEELYGNVLRRASEKNETKFISTGIDSLDKLIKYPIGAIIELLGGSSIKSSIAYRAISQFQKTFPNKTILYVSTSNGYHIEWAQKLGVNNNNVYLLNSNNIVQIFDISKTLILGDAVSGIIIDDIPGLSLPKDIKDDFNFNQTRAQYLDRYLKNIKQYIETYGTSVFLINQPRTDDISIGGKSIIRNSDIRIRFDPIEKNHQQLKTRVRLLKNNYGVVDSTSIIITLNYNIGFE